MNNEYSLSIIIPNYNNQKYLKKCLDSVFKQTYNFDEVIVVDDKSTDESIDFLEKYNKKHEKLVILKLEKNGGVSNARNEGLKIAKGNYVTFLDADDFYGNEEKLQNEMNLIKFYKSNYNKDIIAYSKILFISNDEKDIKYPPINKKLYSIGNVTFNLLTEKSFETIMRDYCLKKESIISIGGYNQNKKFYEDLELLLKLSKKYEFYCTYEIGTAYRDSINGLSKRNKSEHHKARKEIYDEFELEYSFFKKSIISIRRFINKCIRKLLSYIR